MLTAIQRMNTCTKCWSSVSLERARHPSSSATFISSFPNTTGLPSASTLLLKSFTGIKAPSSAFSYGILQVIITRGSLPLNNISDLFINLGQERFGNMTRVYYKEAVGAFIVFDVTRGSTFESVAKWKQDLDTKVQLPDGSPIPCVLLANKVT